MQSIPKPNDASDKIWLQLAHWLRRYSSLKMFTEARTDLHWHSIRCDSQNYSSRTTQDLSSFDTGNKYSVLDSSADFSPHVTSTPSKVKHPAIGNKKINCHLKMANINFQSIKGKKPQLYAFLDSHRPDIVVGTESWLTPDIHDSELPPP